MIHKPQYIVSIFTIKRSFYGGGRIKIIFLDIDGVLNCANSNSRCGSYIGIDDEKVKALLEIVEQTGAKIVLCSSWKDGWDPINKQEQYYHANYLDKKLKKGGLYAFAKTKDEEEDREKIFKTRLHESKRETALKMLLTSNKMVTSAWGKLYKSKYFKERGIPWKIFM